MRQSASLQNPRIRLPPMIVTVVAALVGPLAYFAGAGLAGVGIALGFVSFSIAVYIVLILEPTPPFSRIGMVIFLLFAVVLGSLGAPEYFDPPFHGYLIGGLAVAAFALGLGASWWLFVRAAEAKRKAGCRKPDSKPEP